jgi:undecaprenyl-diphosphatase
MRRTVGIVVLGFAALLAALVAAGFLLHAVAGRGPVGFDRTITDAIVDLRSPGLTRAVEWVQLLGRSEFLLAVVAVSGILLATRWARAGLVLFLACIGAETMVDVVKPVVDRMRPPAHLWLEATGRGAFPSGHAVISTTVALAVVAAIGVATARRPPWWAWTLAALVSVWIGLSRVYLGVHWVTDVLAGWAAGAAWVALLVAAIARPAWDDVSPSP